MALSRARLGLYIVGRKEVFEACYELRSAFELLLQRPDKLVLSTGEMWPSNRILAEEEGTTAPNEATMENLEHLGQFVYEMTASKFKELDKSVLQPVREEYEAEYVDAGTDEEDEEIEE